MYSGVHEVRHTCHGRVSNVKQAWRGLRRSRLDFHRNVLSCPRSCPRSLSPCTGSFFAKTLSFATRLASSQKHVIVMDAHLPSVVWFDPTRVKQVREGAEILVRERGGRGVLCVTLYFFQFFPLTGGVGASTRSVSRRTIPNEIGKLVQSLPKNVTRVVPKITLVARLRTSPRGGGGESKST